MGSKNTTSTKKSHRRKVVGPWRLGRTIGKGSSGKVKLVRNVRTGDVAAVKIVSKNAPLNPKLSEGKGESDRATFRRSVEREIVIMKLIDHPNVLKLYDVWETSDQLYLIMEYVEGGELFDYIVEHTPLPLSEIVDYFQQIISAVHHCHYFNVAHRDLKPENILLDGSHNIKIADFGMATWDGSPSLLSTACGSPHYASPEIVNGEKYKGAKSDVWSCGVVLHALLVGRLPFDDNNIVKLLEKVRSASFTIPANICKEGKDLLSRMLEKDVSKRISIPEIMNHPFFLKYPPRSGHIAQIPTTRDKPPRPLSSMSDIDADIFENLRSLWHGTSDRKIVGHLLSAEKNWEKTIYHLLQEYRETRLEENGKSDISNNDMVESTSSLVLRPSHPTPRKATEHKRQAASWSPPPGDSGHPPLANKRKHRRHSSESLGRSHSHSSFHSASSKPEQSVLMSFPPRLVGTSRIRERSSISEIQATSDRQFFSTFVDRLNRLESSLEEEHYDDSLQRSPSPQKPGVETGRRVLAGIQSEKQIDRKGPKEGSHSGGWQGGKENVPPSRSEDFMYVQQVNRRVQIDEPIYKYGQDSAEITPPLTDSQTKFEYLPNPYTWTSSSITQTSTASSASRVSWLTSLFHLKQTSSELLSCYNLETSVQECQDLLERLGMSTTVSLKPRTAVMKCKLIAADDNQELLVNSKALHFRVDFKASTKAQAAVGYCTLMTLALERGPSASFKAVYGRLREDWYYDIVNNPDTTVLLHSDPVAA